MNLDLTKEWYEEKVLMENDREIGAGEFALLIDPVVSSDGSVILHNETVEG